MSQHGLIRGVRATIQSLDLIWAQFGRIEILPQHQSNPGQITDLGADLFDGRIHSANS